MSSESTSLRLALALAALLGATACGPNIVHVSALTWTQSPNVSTDVQTQAIVRAVEVRGYTVALVQAHRGRVGVFARYTDRWVERYGTYRIAITCEPHQRCEVRPIGPRVEFVGDGYRVPEPMADELVALRADLQRLHGPGLR